MPKRVGILRGGIEDNYESSLRRGGEFISYIIENLSDKWRVVDILVDRDGVWHVTGVPINPADLMHRVDVVWNMAHPQLSSILESFSIPTIGAPSFSSTLHSRETLGQYLKNVGVKMPRRIVFPLYQEDFDGPKDKYAEKKAKEVFEKFSSPWVVKSLTRDSHMGIHVVKIFPELVEAIKDGVSHEQSILVEELIGGKGAEVHSVGGFRGEEAYTMPVVGLSSWEKEKLTYVVKNLSKHLGAKHYLKSNFVLGTRGQIYLTDVDFSPDLEQDSHFCRSCESIGAKSHHVIDHILEKALQ